MNPSQKTHKFVTLDSLRGVAALVVLELHTRQLFGHSVFQHGYLAVDFFFMLSGFVLSYAYQAKLDNGWSTLAFLKARVIRLYPIYFAGLVFGFSFDLFRIFFGNLHRPMSTTFVLVIFGTLLIPNLFSLRGIDADLYPFNNPTWSLCYEFFGNLLHAIFFRRRGWMTLLGAIVLFGLLLCHNTLRFGSQNYGVGQNGFVYAFCRVLFSYTTGMLLQRLWKTQEIGVRIPPFIASLLLLASCAIPTPTAYTAAYDLFVTICVFPILILAGASSQSPACFPKLSSFLGNSSFAIYLLQVPFTNYFVAIWEKIRGHHVELDAPWPGIINMILISLLAIAVDRFYDIPVRRFLRERFEGKSDSKAKQSLQEESLKVT